MLLRNSFTRFGGNSEYNKALTFSLLVNFFAFIYLISVFVFLGGYSNFHSCFPDFCTKPGSPLSSDADDEDCASDESPIEGRFSPLSPLSGLAPSILGLGALRISCDIKENNDVPNIGVSRHQFSTPHCDNHQHHSPCPRHNQFNSEEDIDDAQSFANSKCLAQIRVKPTPINLSACSCCSCDVETPDGVYPSPCGYVNASGPAEIIPGLFLGCAKDAASAETLRKCNITYILNVTPNLPNVFENDSTYKYKQIPITDHWSQNLSQFFPEAISFIGK